MADESEWDPAFDIRFKNTWAHIKKNLTPAAIKATLMPNKNDD